MLPEKNCDLHFEKTVTRWDEAIPLGNGACGALIWGASNGLRFSLDRGDIWDVTPFAGVHNPEFTYQTMVELAQKGDAEGIRRIFDAPYNRTLPSKLPAGKLIFDFGCDKNVASTLHVGTAEADLQIGQLRLKSFLHAVKPCGFIMFNQPLSAVAFHIENPKYSVKTDAAVEDVCVNSVNTGSLALLFYKEPELFCTEDTQYFVQEISAAFSYGVFVRAKSHADTTELCYCVATSNDGKHWKEKALALLDEALTDGYEASFAAHTAWWADYWGKSGVTLPDALFQKQWYLTQYLFASCSRKGCLPMPLQGVWTADDGALPPWKGDYHHDLNTQMSYYHYLKSNHIEEGESFLDYLWSMTDCARKFAKSFYHASGLCLPSTMSLDGAPLGGWGMYSLSPTNQLWLCQAFERHYRFTGDKAFLREKAYPYCSEVAAFILSLLRENETDGLLYLPISSSPEIHDDNREAFLTPNSNYDLSLLRYLFTALAALAKELQNGEEATWLTVLKQLPQLAVNGKKCLMLSPDECLKESHRHLAHAMAIHPLRLLRYETAQDKEIIDATILDLERLGTGYWVGYSFTWMAELYAIAKNGNGAAYQLRVFWENHCSQNGFHLNGDYKKRGTSTFHYRPFTLEGNMCAADALQEMLLQSEDGVIELFPAIPDDWREKTVAFEQFRAENGLLVSACMEHGSITKLRLKPQQSGVVTLRKTEALRLPPQTECAQGYALSLEAGREVRVL